jgi:hypothetical protein
VGVLATLLDQLRRRLLGVSPEEIRYTFEDVRRELRATRAELQAELAALRAEVEARGHGEDRVRGPETPVAEA